MSEAKYSAFDTAAYYLSFKDRTRIELIEKLKEKGYDESEIDDAMVRLTEYGYVNDERYALSFIRSNQRRIGARRISQELSRKGIDREIIRESLAEENQDEDQIVYDLVRRRYASADLNDEKQYRKAYNFLLRRGFSYEIIGKTLAIFKKKDEF